MHALSYVISILHVQKLRLREIKWLTEGYTASRWHSQDLNQCVTQSPFAEEPWLSAWGGNRVCTVWTTPWADQTCSGDQESNLSSLLSLKIGKLFPFDSPKKNIETVSWRKSRPYRVFQHLFQFSVVFRLHFLGGGRQEHSDLQSLRLISPCTPGCLELAKPVLCRPPRVQGEGG